MVLLLFTISEDQILLSGTNCVILERRGSLTRWNCYNSQVKKTQHVYTHNRTYQQVVLSNYIRAHKSVVSRWSQIRKIGSCKRLSCSKIEPSMFFYQVIWNVAFPVFPLSFSLEDPKIFTSTNNKITQYIEDELVHCLSYSCVSYKELVYKISTQFSGWSHYTESALQCHHKRASIFEVDCHDNRKLQKQLFSICFCHNSNIMLFCHLATYDQQKGKLAEGILKQWSQPWRFT